ncbi:MAG: ABC transporter ATP-binding protein [Alphaproteobacteria bacterium]|jgi:NitT/TauT family transport system ATP-binding protein|nr:ABC transporter ATP-binding protein [Alphaproteobacteria bacterium]
MSAVVVDQVTKVYVGRDEDVHALGPVSLTMQRGETVAIVGPSGCGKSTLLRIIAGLDDATAGTITVDGRRVVEPLDNVGIVFQRDLLLDWRNILDNVLLPTEFMANPGPNLEQRARDLLDQLGVGGFAKRFPWELSGGMRQRVAIARAMMCRPSMLFLDEPFSALDALTRDQMGVILQKVQAAQSVTTLLITHSIPEAVFLSDRVIVMSGRPGIVLDEIVVDAPRPRRLAFREEPAFAALTRRIRLHFERTGVLVE